MTVLTNVVNYSYEGPLLLLKAIQRSQDIRGEQRARQISRLTDHKRLTSRLECPSSCDRSILTYSSDSPLSL